MIQYKTAKGGIIWQYFGNMKQVHIMSTERYNLQRLFKRE